jgi:GDP-D-mannose dehydratase
MLLVFEPQSRFCRHVQLGNLDAKRDWGHARDYVVAMWLMLQVLTFFPPFSQRNYVTIAIM